jgi:hypothetical protein
MKKLIVFAVLLGSFLEVITFYEPASDTPENYCGLNYHLTNGGGDRIVGGRESNIDEFPWIVSIHLHVKVKSQCNVTIAGTQVLTNCTQQGWIHGCAGALLNSQTILTAGHCSPKLFGDLMGIDIVGRRLVVGCHRIAGQTNITESVCQVAHFTQDDFIPHPEFRFNYETSNLKNDIAIIVLKKEQFRFMSETTKAVGSVCLPDPEPAASPGKTVITAGWGRQEEVHHPDPSRMHLVISSDSLKTVDLRIHDQEKCKRNLHNATWILPDVDQIFCASSRSLYEGPCHGDSGGPVTMIDNDRYYVVGVVSFGERCGRSYYHPGFFTRVSHYLPWIRRVIEQRF